MRRTGAVGCVVALGLWSGCSAGESVDSIESELVTSTSFQDGVLPSTSYAGTRDTMLQENAPTTKSGSATALSVSGDTPSGSGKDQETLVQWDLSATVPTDAVVQSASLTVTVSDKAPQSYQLYELLRPWTESDATWNAAASGVPWATPGALAASDRGATSLGAINAAATGEVTITLNAAGIAVVQKWVSQPSTNHGVIFAGTSNDNRLEIRSSEYSTKSARPRLYVTWQGSGTPGPAVYKNTCDGSGAIALDGNYFLDFNDETQAVRVYARGVGAAPARTIDVSSAIGLATSDEADLEDAVRVGDRVYVIGSHGRDKNGNLERERYKFFAADLSGTAPNVSLSVAGSYGLLLDDMLSAASWTTPNSTVITALANASQLSRATVASLAPKVSGTAIEGITALGSAPGPLAIAFRNPQSGGAAIVVTLTNPDAVVSGARAHFGQAMLWNLGGNGVRGMTWSETLQAVLVLSGPHDAADGPFALWRWSGLATDAPVKLQDIVALPAAGAHPEAIVAYPGERDVQILFDQGSVQVDGGDCKDASTTHQWFTDAIVHIP